MFLCFLRTFQTVFLSSLLWYWNILVYSLLSVSTSCCYCMHQLNDSRCCKTRKPHKNVFKATKGTW